MFSLWLLQNWRGLYTNINDNYYHYHCDLDRIFTKFCKIRMINKVNVFIADRFTAIDLLERIFYGKVLARAVLH